jgi:MFS family permease
MKKNKALKLLLNTNALILISGAMLGPIYALFVKEIGGDLLDASIAGSLLAFVGGITVLLTGRLSDKVKRPEFIVALGYLVIGLGFLLYLMADSIWWIFAIQSIIGFGGALYAPAFDALYSIHLDKHSEGSEWGEWEAMNYFTSAAGALIGGFIVTTFGFSPLFIIMALLCFISSIYIFLLSKKVLK